MKVFILHSDNCLYFIRLDNVLCELNFSLTDSNGQGDVDHIIAGCLTVHGILVRAICWRKEMAKNTFLVEKLSVEFICRM